MQLDRDPSENSSTTSCCHFDGIVLLSWTMIFVLKNSQQGVCVSCAVMRSLQEPSVEGRCTQHHPICCHWERDLRETMFEIQKKNVPDAISYIICTTTEDVKFSPKVFLWTSLQLVLFTHSHWSAGFVFVPLVFCLHTQSTWLSPQLCSFLNPHAVCINPVWHPASSFSLRFVFGTYHLWPALTHWGGESISGDPHGCIAVPVLSPSKANGALMDPRVLQGLSQKNPMEIKICCTQNPLFGRTGKEGLLWSWPICASVNFS